MKFDGFMQVREEVFSVVATRIEMKFMPNAFREQLEVQFTRALSEAKLILLAAIEVDGLGFDGDAIFPGQFKGIIRGPVRRIDRIAENIAEQSCQRTRVSQIGVHLLGCLGNQCRTLGAHRAKQFRMCERKAQSAVSAHGKTGDAAMAAVMKHSKMSFDVGQEFREKEVAITIATGGVVDEKAATTLRRNHKEVADFVLLAKIFDQTPTATAEKRLLVFAQAVKKIERRVLSVFVSFVTGRQHHTVAHSAMQDLAIHAAAVDSALSCAIWAKKQERRQRKQKTTSVITRYHEEPPQD
jgi:hypothetical protein